MNEYIIDNGVLKKYNGSASNVEIPSGVVEIAVRAFSDNDSIVSVTIPEGVKIIQNCAFENCCNLESVSFPEGLESIKAGAFGYCKLLKTALIPESVEYIGVSAFKGCSGLKKVVLHSNVKTESLHSVRPADGMFNGCDSLKTAGSINSGCNVEFGWTDAIPDAAFLGSSLSKATIPDTIKSIGHLAFYRKDEKKLKLTLPKNCKLGRRALPEDAEIILSGPIDSKDRIDASLLDYVDKRFVKKLSDEELAWIILFQSNKWRTTILSYMSNDQQIISVLKACCSIVGDAKKVSKGIGDALVELQSRIKDRDLRHSSAEKLYEFLKNRQ